MTTGKRDLVELHQLRNCLFSKAKRLWGFGVVVGYFAIFAVPTARWLVGWQDLPGPAAIAAVLAILGRVWIWRSECYREDAEWTLRAIELNRGIGLEVNTVRLADLKLKYFRHLEKHDNSVRNDDYYEEPGKPSHGLLIKIERESAWWTEQLAKKAWKLIFIAAVVGALALVLTITLGGLEVEDRESTTTSEFFWKVYTLIICALVLLDTFRLGLKYYRLSVAAKKSMETLTALLDQVDSVSVYRLMSSVADYQCARKEGPLIPNWFHRHQKKSLQRVWNETLSKKGSRNRP